MNKNNIVRVVAGILSLIVVLTAYGCKKGDKNANTSINENQPVIENSTAIINYTSVNEKGKEVDVTKVADVADQGLDTVKVEASLSDKLKDDTAKQEFVDRKDDYQISDDKADEIVNNPAQWSEFSYTFYIVNPNPQMMVFAKIAASSNSDIIINTDLGCEQGLASGNGISIQISGIVNTSKYSDAEKIKAELSKMNVKVIYTLVDANKNNGIDDWNKVTTKLAEIKIADK